MVRGCYDHRWVVKYVWDKKVNSESSRRAAAEVELSSNVRFSEGWLVWSHCPNSKSEGQENSIEFPLDSCPDFILLYMVCVQWLLSRYSMTRLLIPSYHSIADLAKHGDHGPTSPYKGRPALLRLRQSPVHHPLSLQSSECLLPLSIYHIAPQWGLVSLWQVRGRECTID